MPLRHFQGSVPLFENFNFGWYLSDFCLLFAASGLGFNIAQQLHNRPVDSVPFASCLPPPFVLMSYDKPKKITSSLMIGGCRQAKRVRGRLAHDGRGRT
jgi:hypothetical protein